MSEGSPAQRLKGLAAAAMLGAERAGDSPSTLLNSAAALGALARAGLKPARLESTVDPCPHDATPVAGAKTMATLARLLSDPDAGLIAEWAVLAHRAGVRVADDAAPLLLDWWSRQARPAPEVFLALGTRGEWLASMNPAWRRPAPGGNIPADADDIWQTGKAPEREAVLRAVRRAAPARGLEMIRSTWRDDGAEERRRFLDALGEHCSMNDEPFLEEALDDRSKVVRRQAALVLSRIPGSRLLARMNERAKAIIIVETKRGLLSRGVKVSLRLPEAYDPSWARDGIEEHIAGTAAKRSWWMRQILSSADLDVWTRTTGLDPAGLLEALAQDDFFADALAAMLERASTQADAPWRQALARTLVAQETLELPRLQNLLRGLDRPLQEALRLEVASNSRLAPVHRWAILAADDEPWTGAYSAKALPILAKCSVKAEPWRTLQSLEEISRLVAPEAMDAFERTVNEAFGDSPTEGIKKCVSCARLRAEMHKEFFS